MFLKSALCGLALLCLAGTASYAQSVDSATNKALNFPSRLLAKLQCRTARLNQQLTQQTTNYLLKMQKREERMRKKLSAVDSNAAKQMFAGSAQQYDALAQKIKTDTGTRSQTLSGTYMPYLDSLQGTMKFLGAPGQVQALQAKMQDASQVQSLCPAAQTADRPIHQPACQSAGAVE